MLLARSNREEKTVPVAAPQAPPHRRDAFPAYSLPSLAIAAIAAALIGVFLSGLFQLRAYQQKPVTAVAIRPAKAALPPLTKAMTAGTAPSAIVTVPEDTEAAIPLPEVPTRSIWQNDAERENEEDAENRERGHGRKHDKHKAKHGPKHGKHKD